MVAVRTVNPLSFETGGSSPSPPTVAKIASGEKFRHTACPVKARVVDLVLGEMMPPIRL